MQTEQLIERYLETWNETDADARRTAVADVYADGAQYVDPLADVTGHDQISELIGAVQQQVPGHVFRLADGGVDAHHNIARFSWELVRQPAASLSRSASTSRCSRKTAASSACSASSTRRPEPEARAGRVRLGIAPALTSPTPAEPLTRSRTRAASAWWAAGDG